MSDFNACGHFLIVELESVPDEAVSKGGIIMATSTSDKNKEQAGMALATIVDIGKNCWAGFYDRDGDSHAWCEVGDKVMIAKYAGQAFPAPECASLAEKEMAKRIKLIKDDDVLAVQKKEISDE